jgi:hypothetical protein
LIDKLIVARLLKKFFAFYGTIRINTVFTRVHYHAILIAR